MDFTQNKLSKKEWETIEVPVSGSEKQILSMIKNGFHNVNIRSNETESMYSFIKIEQSPEIDYFLYKTYFEAAVLKMIKKYGDKTPIGSYSVTGGNALKTMKSADSVRIQNVENNININKPNIFEYLLLDFCNDLLKQAPK